MWRDDDFEDKGKQIKAVLKDETGAVITNSDLKPDGTAERSDDRDSGY